MWYKESSLSVRDVYGLDRLSRLLGLLHYRSAGVQTTLFEDYILALCTLLFRTLKQIRNVSVIHINMLSAYVLQNKFKCFSGQPSDKHVKCKRTSFVPTSTPQMMKSGAENKKHRGSSEVNICVLGFVFTKLITMYQEHCTWGLESKPLSFWENYSFKHLVVLYDGIFKWL